MAMNGIRSLLLTKWHLMAKPFCDLPFSSRQTAIAIQGSKPECYSRPFLFVARLVSRFSSKKGQTTFSSPALKQNLTNQKI